MKTKQFTETESNQVNRDSDRRRTETIARERVFTSSTLIFLNFHRFSSLLRRIEVRPLNQSIIITLLENFTKTPQVDILNSTFPAVTVMPVFIPIPIPIPFPLAKSYPIKRKSEDLDTTQTKTLPLDLTVKKM